MLELSPTNISRRVTLAMILVVAVIMLGFAGVLIVENFWSLERELNERASVIAQLAEKSLPFPMWNIDEPTLNNFIQALFTDHAMVYAEYEITGSEIVTTTTNAQRHPEFAQQPWTFFEQSPRFLVRSVNVFAQDTDLGFVRFAVSKDAIRADLWRRVITISIEMVLLILAITLTSLTITTRSIIQPLRTLQNSAERLAQGDLDQPIETGRRDELGRLAHSFANMRDAIREKILDLNRVNADLSKEIMERRRIEEELREYQEHLEELVKNRTDELLTTNIHLQQEIAERKHAEEAANAANQAKSTFLANMSHELRTPLNSILGFAQIMTSSSRIPPEEQEQLAIIHRSGEHLLLLINQVLELSKIEAGKITLNESTFDLYGLLDSVIDLFRLRATQKGLHLNFDRSPNVPRYIRTDETRLRQVLINLLNNAIKFTKEGGVTLRISSIGNWQLPIANCQLRFEIEDTGPGITPEECEHLFEAFVQTETGRQTREGSGLGLLISRKFVQLMGGDISIQSTVGTGTTCTFDIRVDACEAPEAGRPRLSRRVTALEPGQPCYRMLIVDDNSDNRHLFVKLLKPLGFDLREAENGQDALQIWETWKPHLIWMDMRMPVMDGYETTKTIRKLETGWFDSAHHDGHPERSRRTSIQFQTIIIAITASAFEEERVKILEAGCDDFLRKPVQTHEVFDLIQQHLGVRFVYEECERQGVNGERQRESGNAKEVLTPEMLAALPEDVRTTLQYAIESLDLDLTIRLIDRIRQQNASLADTLAELVKNFRFDKIQAIFEQLTT